jgi:hypothetical protein
MRGLTLRDIFTFTYDRIKLRVPNIKPLRFIAYDEDNPLTCAYEDNETIAVAIGRCLDLYGKVFTSAQFAIRCTSLLAHEIIGHDQKYGVIKPPAEIVLEQSTSDDENVPYHVQFAISGHRECMKKIEDHHCIALNWIVHNLLIVRDEVTRFLDGRNPSKRWCRQ